MKQLPADATLLAKELKPILDAMEKGRLKSIQQIQKGWKKIGLGALVTAGAAILILALSSALTPEATTHYRMSNMHGSSTGGPNASLIFSILVAVAGLIYSIVIYTKYIKGHASVYQAGYKSKVISGVTRLIQPGMTYQPDRGISEHSFQKMGLYSGDIDRYHSEDLFAGRIGKTSLMFAEAHAEDKRTRTDSKGKSETYWVTIFQGLLCIVDFNKEFRSWVTVKPDFAESSFGWLGRKVQGLSGDLIRLESPEFERAFVVHGGDQVAARYILTPDLQERLLELRRWFGDDIRLAFHNSKLHLTIPNTDNWFEPSIKRPAHDLSQMHDFIHQMTSIFRLVEMLDLNTRIWTKQ